MLWLKKIKKILTILLNGGFVTKACEESEEKLKGHYQFNGKYWESAHQECNLDLSISKKMSVMFHNLKS